MERIAKLHISTCKTLTYEAKHCQPKIGLRRGRLRIGFLSAFLHNHTIGKLFRGVVEHFSRDDFEVILFRLPGKCDDMSKIIDQAADKIVPLNQKLDSDRKTIAEEELDILLYFDIGMDPYTYFLSFSRLAPIQAVSIGHAETSGVPNIDYFLSSELFEIPTASSHYTEKLVKLPILPGYYFRPEPPLQQYIRRDYGLPESVRLYVYPQNLIKIHPNFDETICELLRQDPNGRLILIEGPDNGHWEKRLCERFNRQSPDVLGQVIFIPKMTQEKFLGLLILADAILDNPYLSGVTSCLEAFGMGAPIVAWPGKYFSGRCVAACYKQMGLTDLIATDEKSFLKLALKLSHNKEFQLQMQTKIKTNSHKLFERIDAVREMEKFFLSAHKHLLNNQCS